MSTLYREVLQFSCVSKVLLGALVVLFFGVAFIDIQPFVGRVSENLTRLGSGLMARAGNHRRGDESACDLLDGSWVYDEELPMYEPEGCEFIDEAFRCKENGRRDDGYAKWRWKPNKCEMPRFDAEQALERLRGKRLAFVGDSIGRNQWESMMCLLTSGIRGAEDRARVFEIHGEPITKHTGFLAFRFPGHANLSVEYYRAPYIVPRGSPPRGSPPNVSSTLKIDTMDWLSPKYSAADFLVFNTDHWWIPQRIMQDGCYFEIGGRTNMSMRIEDGFKVAMRTWRKWVATELDVDRTKVFFRTYAPTHFRGGDWDSGGRCDNETQPWPAGTVLGDSHWTRQHVVAEVEHLRGMGVRLLDVTAMSDYRKDAHCSIYSNRTSDPKRAQDCSHWCLPGLPDIWNHILLTLMFS